MLEFFLEQALKYANEMNMAPLHKELKNYIQHVWTERPPKAIDRIPDYIPHWENKKGGIGLIKIIQIFYS
jgi:hypothetical protein